MPNCFALGVWIVCTFSNPTIDDLFTAIEDVEGWTPVEHSQIGRHIGPYQISWAYWYESETPGVYLQCLNKEYAQQVMLNNWHLHIPEALAQRDYETLARFHNGGPDGPIQPETLEYWRLVQARLY